MEANYIDLPTILIYLFWIGFALLIIYLRREDKRVGYPLDSDREGAAVQGYPAIPSPRAPRAKHPALEGTNVAPHQQPLPADAMQSAAFGDAAVGAAYAAATPTPSAPAEPAPEAAAPSEPAHDEAEGHDHSDEEPNR
ncbi:MAG TPA: hypothetical protein VJ925_01395 [Longimicrobiales bacterium]|nr:hypothetical protein [Longimicrobiales bacterium]